LALAVPIFSAVLILAPEGVTLMYARGNFTAEAAGECACALRALSLTIPAHAMAEVLYRAFCAAKKAGAAALSALFSLCVLICANVLSLAFGGGLTGVCAALAIAEWAHALFLFFTAKKFFPHFRAAKARVLAPGAVLCLAAMALSAQIFPFFSLFSGSISIFLKITIVFTVGLVVYLLYILLYLHPAHFRAKRERR